MNEPVEAISDLLKKRIDEDGYLVLDPILARSVIRWVAEVEKISIESVETVENLRNLIQK